MTATAIGIDGSSYVASPTGAMRRTRELASHLAALGWRPILFLPRHSCEFFANTSDVEMVPLDIRSRPGPWRARLAAKLLPDLLARNDCRLLLTETPPFSANLPTVFTVHDLAAWDVQRPAELAYWLGKPMLHGRWRDGVRTSADPARIDGPPDF